MSEPVHGVEPAETYPELKRTWPILVTCWLAMFTQASQFLIVAPILPRIGEQLDVAESLLGTLVSGYAITLGTCALIAGPISDRFGRRTILRFGTSGMGLALVLHGLAFDYASLMGLRVLAGAAAGILSGGAVAYIGDVIPYHRRGAAMGWVMSGMAFGQIIGIPAGTMLADWHSFQAPFVVFGVVMLVAWVLTMVVLPPVEMNAEGDFTVGTALRAYAELVRRPEIAAMCVASATMMLSVSAYIVYEPAWLEQKFDATPAIIASLFLVGGIANATVGPFAGWLSDRVGRKSLIVSSSWVLAALMGVTPFLPSLELIYGLFIAIMSAVAIRMSPMNALLTALVDLHRRGSLMSITMSTGQIGFAAGAAIAGWSYVSYGYVANALAAAAGAALTGLILLLWVPEPEG